MIKCLNCECETTNPKFCGSSCSASYNNRGIRRHGSSPHKQCLNCENETINRKYCCFECSSEHKKQLKHDRIEETKNFDNKYGHVSMKKYLVMVNKGKCMECGNSEWNGKPMPLEIHHINGKSKDNSLCNLMVLCPNCHTFTDTYKSKNTNSDREYFKVNQRR